MSSDKKKKAWAENGLEDWGAYMAAKKEKLEDQFEDAAKKEFQDATSLFRGVAIFVNGYTNPCADKLKRLMMAHGGIYHHYMRSRITTHIIASNLPYSKIIAYRKSQNPLPICKPEWITDSIKAQKLVDWRPYVLYSNCSKSQPPLRFNEETSASSSGSKKDWDHREGVISGNTTTADEVKSRSEDEVRKEKTSWGESTMVDSGALSTKRPEFLSEFYNNSRLHHISTMGITLKDYVAELRDKSNGKLEGLENLMRAKDTKRASDEEEEEERRLKNDEVRMGGATGPASDSDEDFFDSEVSNTRELKLNETIIMHIDMDCFFVSVGLRKHPELKGLPIAVAHARGVGNRASSSSSSSSKGGPPTGPNNKARRDGNDDAEQLGSMSEIASCSYEARKAGVKNGMFLGQALKLCPNLRTIKYDFDGYKEVSYALYDTVASYTLLIEAVSCDEMYADVTNILRKTNFTPIQFAKIIRKEIKAKTQCPVSTGFGCNKLQARIATRIAKPDGQFHLESQHFEHHIASMSVTNLPGVGYSTMKVLNKMNVRTCSDLLKIPLSALKKEFGMKTGESLHNMSRGIDNAKLAIEHVRKSVSAEINYGIRFETADEAEEFLRKLSHEVCTRLQKANSKGRSVALKLMVRAKDAPKETLKFMGHGVCDHFTKSKNLIAPVDDPVVITREVISLWGQMQQHFEDIRGIGIQITRLESTKGKINGGIMNFIEKSKQPNVEIMMRRQGKDERLATGGPSNAQRTIDKIRSANEETRATKSRGLLRAFLVNKKESVAENGPRTSNGSDEAGQTRQTNEEIIQEIDESVLAELPEEIKREILESRRSSKIDNTDGRVDDDDDDDDGGGGANLITDEKFAGRDYDESVFRQLPEEIRDEILAERQTKWSKTNADHRQTHQENYFKNTKSIVGRSKKATMPPIEEIDMSVLIELPENIRNEIINEYRSEKEERRQQGEKRGAPVMPNNNDTRREELVQDANLSFSQIDPDFLAALSDDIKDDVEMYCMVKKKEKLAAEGRNNLNDFIGKNRTLTKSNKKSGLSNRMKNNAGNDLFKVPPRANNRKNVRHNILSSRVGEIVDEKTEIQEENDGNWRFLENKYPTAGTKGSSAGPCIEQTQEIMSHHSSFIGNKKTKTEEQEMVTSLVNYLFTLPRRQVQMQIQTWIFNSNDVNEIDLLSLATFLSMLPKKKRLEDLHILLKSMHRCISKTGSCVWHETYVKTVSHVQHYMQIEYKSEMMLPAIECNRCYNNRHES